MTSCLSLGSHQGRLFGWRKVHKEYLYCSFLMLLQKAKALKLKYFGHIKRHETLERHILEARIDGRRGRGRPTRRWEQDINDWMDMTTTQAGRLAEDRILFLQKVQEATSRQEMLIKRESFLICNTCTCTLKSILSSLC